MGLKEFTEKIEKAMVTKLEQGSDVRVTMIRKNNSVYFTGMIIKIPGRNVYPTIYLEPYWEMYEAGLPLSEVVEQILAVYRESCPETGIDFGFFEDFEKVKDRICFRLINRERNLGLLEQIPYIPFLDLAICFYYSYENSCLGKGSILIYNSHMEKWGVQLKEVWKSAFQNTPKLYPVSCQSMEKMLRELMKNTPGEAELWPELCDCKLDVLSNQCGSYGAGCILYPGYLEHLAEEQKRDCYILPSSIHEVILFWEEPESIEALKCMVQEINKQEVSPMEILSDSIYLYNRKDKKIKRIL